jgi:hypothetical protein
MDLRHEIGVDNLTGVVDCHPGLVCHRRMHSARVEGRKPKVMVMYHGPAQKRCAGHHPPIMWSQLNSFCRNGGRNWRNMSIWQVSWVFLPFISSLTIPPATQILSRSMAQQVRVVSMPSFSRMVRYAIWGVLPYTIHFHYLDLVPFTHFFLNLYRSSHFATVYFFAYSS